MADQLQAAQHNLRSYIGAITAGVENERRSLARELHDDTIQSLISLNQRIQIAMTHASPGDKENLGELQQLLQQTMEGLRLTIRGLRPIYLEDLGLAASLEMLTAETGKVSGLAIIFRKDGTERRLSVDTEMMLYRMAQESLSNVIRHAQAKQASLALTYTPDGLRLEITDDGKGFKAPTSPAEFPRQGHFGLIGLHERAELIGASLEIISAPWQGTRVVIQLVQKPDSSTPQI